MAALWDRHKEVGRRLALGQSNKQVAEAMNITPVAVSYMRNSPVMQEHVSNLQGASDAAAYDVAKRIQEMAPSALKVLDGILKGYDDASPTLRAHVAKDILDRAGHAAVKNLNVRSVHAIVSPADLEIIKRRAIEIAEENRVLIVD